MHGTGHESHLAALSGKILLVCVKSLSVPEHTGVLMASVSHTGPPW